jgi:hypothetical protein
MATETATDAITLDVAGELDAAWVNAGMQPNTGLRIVRHYGSLGKDKFLLEVPGDDSAPCYMRVNGHFQHVTGPTLADWYAEQDAAEASRDAADLYAWASGR